MTPLVDLSRKACDKLRNINVIDFGVPGERTCLWKSETCFCYCYGRAGRWTAGPKPYERLRMIEEMPAKAFYLSIGGAYVSTQHPLRVGRVGDVGNVEHTRAIINAILEFDIPFMWTTRAWRTPNHPSWRLIEKYLPGQVICSVDQDLDSADVPSGWPTAAIAMPPAFEISSDICWCPHYPDPSLPIKPVYNCAECMLCYAKPSEGRRRPNIAFMLHTTGGAEDLPRQHYPQGYWLKHYKSLCKRRPRSEKQTGHESASCGILTPAGWHAPDDNV